MAPPGFCRQIELTNVVAFPQQGKVHLFRVKNPTTKQAEVLALSPRQINDSIWMSDRGWQTSHTTQGVLEPFSHFEVQPVLHVLQLWGCQLYMLKIRVTVFRVRALPPKAALAG